MESTLWSFDPHTLAKHKILKRYIEAWAPILIQSNNGRIVYIDGFAGPGEDAKKQHPGSPIIAIDSIVNHQLVSRFNSEIVLWFVEERRDRADHLRSLIKSKYSKLPKIITYEVENKEFNSALVDMLDQLDKDGRRLAPTFCFVDPFGWDDLDIDLLARFMNQKKAELLITFMAGFIQRFLGDKFHLQSLMNLFTPEQLREAYTKDAEAKGEYLLNAFLTNLLDKIKMVANGKEIYQVSFETRSSSNNLEYYLIYLTSHEKGMEAMKKAMFSVSHTGEFKFSDFDFDPLQKSLVDYGAATNWESMAAEELYNFVSENGLLNRTVPVEVVKSMVLLKTKYFYRKGIFDHLIGQKKMIAYGQTRPGTYTDGKVKIKFV